MVKFGLKNGSSSNWLKFGTGVHCYMLITIFTFIFSKCSSFIFLGANLVPKSEVLQINWNLVQGYIAIWLLEFWCLFFQNFCQSYFLGKFDLKIWSFPNWLKFSAGVHYNMSITILMFIFQKFCHSQNLG